MQPQGVLTKISILFLALRTQSRAIGTSGKRIESLQRIAQRSPRAALVFNREPPGFLSGFGKTGGDMVFVSGKKTKQVAVGNGTERFCAVAVITKAASGKDQRPSLTVFGLKTVECGEGDPITEY